MTSKHLHRPVERILTMKETCHQVGLSRTKIWMLGKEGLFPKPVQIAGTRKGYVESEIQAWIAERVVQRDHSD